MLFVSQAGDLPLFRHIDGIGVNLKGSIKLYGRKEGALYMVWLSPRERTDTASAVCSRERDAEISGFIGDFEPGGDLCVPTVEV